MKATLKYIPALLLAATSLWSCEDTLTETPSSGYDKDTYFSSADKANQAILGILQSISTTQNYGNTEIYLSCADDIVYSNRGVTRDNMRDICNYLTESTNTDVENAWLYKYQALAPRQHHRGRHRGYGRIRRGQGTARPGRRGPLLACVHLV